MTHILAGRRSGTAEAWTSLEGKVDPERFAQVTERLTDQAEHAKHWRDVINTYFFRKSGVPDEQADDLLSLFNN